MNATFANQLPARGKNIDWSHRLIANQPRVRRRFRIYQVMTKLSNEAKREISSVLAGKSEELSLAIWNEVRSFKFLSEDETFIQMKSQTEFEAYLKLHLTKKQTQRALIESDPAPAALSIPDDACHYGELRTLTAREMARIQSFPDDFIFRSKMTTGGQCRKFEVPIYTQIGNAVPVLLGKALGKSVKNLLDRI